MYKKIPPIFLKTALKSPLFLEFFEKLLFRNGQCSKACFRTMKNGSAVQVRSDPFIF